MITYFGDIESVYTAGGITYRAMAKIGSVPHVAWVTVSNAEILRYSMPELEQLIRDRLHASFVNREGELTGTV